MDEEGDADCSHNSSSSSFGGSSNREWQKEDESLSLAQYLCELTLLDAETFLPRPDSHKGAAAVALARHTKGLEAWPEKAVRMSGENRFFFV